MSTITDFFTNNIFLITQQSVGREPVLCNEMLMRVMQSSMDWARKSAPYERIGYLFLPEQIVLLISTVGRTPLDRVMQRIRHRFQVEYDELMNMADTMLLWQEAHQAQRIQDVEELAVALDDIHYRPVQRGYVNRPEEWPYSSFALWQQRGLYPPQWGWNAPPSSHNG